MRHTPMGMPTKEDEARRVAEWDATARSLGLSPTDRWITMWEAIRDAIGGALEPENHQGITLILSWLLVATVGIGGFVAWVWFISLCVRLATRWGWLP
jgi:hypothetical protein